jgi:hypothetical protein
MPTAPIIFGNVQESGDQELAGASPLAVNVLVDGKGAVRRRPGVSAWSGFPTTIPQSSSISGIGSFGADVYWVNALRRIYKLVTGTATATAMTDGTTNTFLDGTARPVFAETPYRLVIAGGEALQRVNTGATVSARLGGSPPNCTSVAALAARLFINDDTSASTTGNIRYSGVGDSGNESWDALDYANAEARPDDVVVLRENANELFAFGETTLQVFAPDPIGVIAPGRARNIGCSAGHSVVLMDESFAWFDDQARFVVSDGRSDQEISAPIAGALDGIATVSDCYGFRVNLDQFDALVWMFPTDGRTFAWQKGGGWSQWHSFHGDGRGHAPLGITAHYYFARERVHLVGLSTGQIAKLDAAANTDLGTTIKAEVVTGFDSRGTDEYKHCEAVRLTFKRGQSATAPVVRLSWRDDLGAFGHPLTISLGATGDYIATVERRSLGRYRRRQWKLEMSDAADLVLAGVRETFSVEGAN